MHTIQSLAESTDHEITIKEAKEQSTRLQENKEGVRHLNRFIGDMGISRQTLLNHRLFETEVDGKQCLIMPMAVAKPNIAQYLAFPYEVVEDPEGSYVKWSGAPIYHDSTGGNPAPMYPRHGFDSEKPALIVASPFTALAARTAGLNAVTLVSDERAGEALRTMSGTVYISYAGRRWEKCVDDALKIARGIKPSKSKDVRVVPAPEDGTGLGQILANHGKEEAVAALKAHMTPEAYRAKMEDKEVSANTDIPTSESSDEDSSDEEDEEEVTQGDETATEETEPEPKPDTDNLLSSEIGGDAGVSGDGSAAPTPEAPEPATEPNRSKEEVEVEQHVTEEEPIMGDTISVERLIVRAVSTGNPELLDMASAHLSQMQEEIDKIKQQMSVTA